MHCSQIITDFPLYGHSPDQVRRDSYFVIDCGYAVAREFRRKFRDSESGMNLRRWRQAVDEPNSYRLLVSLNGRYAQVRNMMDIYKENPQGRLVPLNPEGKGVAGGLEKFDAVVYGDILHNPLLALEYKYVPEPRFGQIPNRIDLTVPFDDWYGTAESMITSISDARSNLTNASDDDLVALYLIHGMPLQWWDALDSKAVNTEIARRFANGSDANAFLYSLDEMTFEELEARRDRALLNVARFELAFPKDEQHDEFAFEHEIVGLGDDELIELCVVAYYTEYLFGSRLKMLGMELFTRWPEDPSLRDEYDETED